MVISYTISKAHKVNSANNNLLSGRWTKAIQLEEATENDKREIPQKFHIWSVHTCVATLRHVCLSIIDGVPHHCRYLLLAVVFDKSAGACAGAGAAALRQIENKLCNFNANSNEISSRIWVEIKMRSGCGWGAGNDILKYTFTRKAISTAVNILSISKRLRGCVRRGSAVQY